MTFNIYVILLKILFYFIICISQVFSWVSASFYVPNSATSREPYFPSKF